MEDVSLRISADTSGFESGMRGVSQSAQNVLNSIGDVAEALNNYGDDNAVKANVQSILDTIKNEMQSIAQFQQQIPQGSANGDGGQTAARKAAEALNKTNLGRLKEELTTVNSILDDLYKKSDSFRDKMNPQDLLSMSATISRFEEVKRGLSGEIDRLEKNAPSGGGKGGFFNTALRAANGFPSFINNMGSGNFAGGAIQGVNAAGTLIRAGSAAAEAAGAESLLGMLGTTGMIVGGVALLGGAALAGGNALANQWEKASGDAMSAHTLFGQNVNQKSADLNSAELRQIFREAAERNAAIGAGFKTSEYLQTMSDSARYGISGEAQAMNTVDSILRWQNFSGANRNSLLNLAGTASRYGGESAETALQHAYAGLTESGMGKGQLDEFLNSMQRVIEDGIANGFVKSSEEVAANLSMLAKLSGGSALWTGEQGANRLMQMSGGVAGSTSLATTAQVVNYGDAQELIAKGLDLKKYLGKDAVITGTYVDAMQVLEKGLTPEMLGQGFKSVSQFTGLGYDKGSKQFTGNVEGAVEWFKQMYDLNYTGASQLLSMYAKKEEEGLSDEDFAKKYARQIENIKINPENRSNENAMKTAVEQIRDSVAQLGQAPADLKTSIINGAANIVSAIRGGKNVDMSKIFDKSSEGLYTKKNQWTAEGKEDSAAFNALKAKFRDVSPEDETDARLALNYMATLSADDKAQLDANGMANKFKDMSIPEIRAFLQGGKFGVNEKQVMRPFEGGFGYRLTLPSDYSFDKFLENQAGPIISAVAKDTGKSKKDVAYDIKKADSYLEKSFRDFNSDGTITRGEMKNLLTNLLSAIQKQTKNNDVLVKAFEDMAININFQ